MRKVLIKDDYIKELENITNEVIEEIKTPSDADVHGKEMFDYINQFSTKSGYGIGVHGTIDTKGLAAKIIDNGLEIDNHKTVLSTVSSFGIRDKVEDSRLQKSMLDYAWKKDQNYCNFVIMVPAVIQNSKNEKLYLGFPPYDTGCAGNDRRKTCPFDAVCIEETKKGLIPKEFILGYYKNKDGKVEFVKNENFYELLTEDKKDELFEFCKSRIKGKYKEVSDAVLNKDVQLLEEMATEEIEKIKREIKQRTKSNILDKGLSLTVAQGIAESATRIKQDDIACMALQFLKYKLFIKETQQKTEREVNRKAFIKEIIAKKEISL